VRLATGEHTGEEAQQDSAAGGHEHGPDRVATDGTLDSALRSICRMLDLMDGVLQPVAHIRCTTIQDTSWGGRHGHDGLLSPVSSSTLFDFHHTTISIDVQIAHPTHALCRSHDRDRASATNLNAAAHRPAIVAPETHIRRARRHLDALRSLPGASDDSCPPRVCGV
jgi:hypothetical protein